MKYNFPINNFSSGVWSPKMASRTDTQEYGRSLKELTNLIVQMQGGAQYRAGTQRWDQAINGTLKTKLDVLANSAGMAGFSECQLIPYEPSSNIGAVLFCINGIVAAGTPVGQFTLPLGADVTLGSNTTLPIPGTGQGFRWHYVQIGDLLVMVDTAGRVAPKIFFYDSVSSSHKLYDINRDYITYQPWKTIPWDRIQALDSDVTLAVGSTITGDITVTASAAKFTSNDVGRYIRLCNGTSLDGVLRIKTFTDTTHVVATVLQTIPNASFTYGSTTNNTSFWQMSDWGDSVGWPRTVTAFQGRLIFGGTRTKPDTIWGTRISNFFDMQEVPSPNTTGTYGFASSAFLADNSRPFTLAPNISVVSNIVALSSSKTLGVHTDAAEIVAYGTAGALGPNDIVFESSTAYGAVNVQPIRINNYSIFVQKTGSNIRDIIYNFNEDQYKSTDLGFVAEHLFSDTQINSLARIQGKSSVLYALSDDFTIAAVTLDRDYQINAWAKIALGDSTDTVDAIYPYRDPSFGSKPFSMAVLEDELYLLSLRYIGVGFKFCLEKMDLPWEKENVTESISGADTRYNQVFLDYSSYLGPADASVTSPTDTFTLPYPYNTIAPVHVVADGDYLGAFAPVADGSDYKITLPSEYAEIRYGYAYPGVLWTAPVEQGGQIGTPVGRIKRVDELVISFFRSANAQFGDAPDNLETIPVRDPQDPETFYTGDKVLNFNAGYERKLSIFIKQDKPYPLFVTCITPRGLTYDS